VKHVLCVYALVSPSRKTPGVTGIGGERLRRISFQRVDAIVGQMSAAPKPTGVVVRRYDTVMRTLGDRFPAVLPARFGTCVADVEELAFILKTRQASFIKSLSLVRNRVQMTVRIFSPAGTEVAAEGRRLRRRDGGFRRGTEVSDKGRRSGKQYLLERAEFARDLPGSEPIRAAVKKWVKAERIEKHEGQRLAGSIFHLVTRSAVRPYHRAVERAAMAADVTTIVSGPWPPYAFADWNG
jgi:hypothetical protein